MEVEAEIQIRGAVKSSACALGNWYDSGPKPELRLQMEGWW